MEVAAMITPEVSAYLEQSLIPLRLSCVTPSGWPVVLSLWYLYRDGRLYCATQERAKVVSYLRHEPRCAFEVASDQPPYCGVRGQARAVIDADLGAEILRQLLLRYLGGTDNPLARQLLSRGQTEVAVIIEPVTLFKWNFTARMKDSIIVDTPKPCPA
jgi:nitroimidazol reductase NimA-like FMN-containing flavoprotein (pyridoxamine 5'-phosphate oxidase superfamily)